MGNNDKRNAHRGGFFVQFSDSKQRVPIGSMGDEILMEANGIHRDAHQHKADIHTWLAWQNPPGRQLHQAVMERILDPKHPKAQIFVNWFRDLYDLHS